MNRNYIFLVLLIFLILGWTANGSAIIYTEMDHGDILWANVGTLDLGSNTISGVMHHDTSISPSSSDVDPFNFTIASGMMLSSISVNFEAVYYDYNGYPTNIAKVYDWAIRDAGWTKLVGSDVDLLGVSPIDLFPGWSGIGAGDYSMMHGVSVSSGDAWEANWALNLQVVSTAPVPEPATFLLLLFGLVGMIGIKKKIS